jgi:hypothetical protein
MKIVKTILKSLAIIIAILLIIALFLKKDYTSRAEIIINAPGQKVFNFLKQLKNQDKFNKWVMVDPNMKREFKGSDGTVGFIYGWNGNKDAGEGEQEITKLEEGKYIETEIRFVRPMKSTANAKIITEAISENQTKVIWINTGKMPYPMNIMVFMVQKMLVQDMDTSLSNLKNILEE